MRDEGDDAALADDPGDGPDAGHRPGRGARPERGRSRSYFFRTHLDESGGAHAPLPAHDELDPSDTIDGANAHAIDAAGSPLRPIRAVDPNATLRHGDGLVIPPGVAPLPPDDEDDQGSPLRPARRTRRASDEGPLPSLEELEQLAADPEATTWGDEDDDDAVARVGGYADEGGRVFDDEELITDLPPDVMPATDAPPFDGPPELSDLADDGHAQLLVAREALDRATRPLAPPRPAPPPRPEPRSSGIPAPAPPPPDERSAARATTRTTARLEPLTLVGGDAEAQKLVRDAIARAAERVAGPDGAVTWRVPMGALVEALRDTLPDPRQEEIARLEEALAEAQGVIEEARARASTLERELAEVRGRSARLEGSSTRLDRELADVRAHVAALERELTEAHTRAARLEEGLARARERQADAEREVAALRETTDALRATQDVLTLERDEALERASGLDDDITLLREEVAGLERELTAARHQATGFEGELTAAREQLAQARAEGDAAVERGRHLEARLAAEQRVAEGARRERDEARDELLVAQDELATARATAARELAVLSREHHEARRSLERELEVDRRERARLEELVVLLLGELPEDEDDPLERRGRGPRRANGTARGPHEVLASLRALVTRMDRLEADRRRALLLPVPPFEQLLERVAALGGDAGHPALARLEARCRAAQGRYAELRDLLHRREGGTRHLAELVGVVREALVIEDVLDALATSSAPT